MISLNGRPLLCIVVHEQPEKVLVFLLVSGVAAKGRFPMNS